MELYLHSHIFLHGVRRNTLIF